MTVIDNTVTSTDSDVSAETVATLPPGGLSNAQWLGLARDAHSISQSYFESSLRQAIVDDMKQAQSQHKSGSKYLSDPYRTRSRLFRPKTRTTIRKNEASAAEAFFSTTEIVSITAEDDGDDMQVASSKVMEQLVQYRLTKSIPWFQIAMGAYQEAQTVGVVCSYQDWDYDPRKRPKPIDRPSIKLVPVENIRLDPAADWTDPINTSPYVIHEMPMYVKDIKARIAVGKWLPVTDGQLLSATKKSMDVVRQTRENKRQDSKSQMGAITDFSIAWVHRNIVEYNGLDFVFYTLGTEAMLSDPVSIEEVYFHGQRPYVMGSMALEAHKIYPGGVPRMTADLQAEINEIANQRIDNVKFAMSKRFFAKRNVQVDIRSLVRNVPGSVTMMLDPEKDVKVVDTPDVTASSYREQDLLNVDFDDIAGSFSQGSVQSNKNLNETVGGMDMLDAKANQVGNYQLRTFAVTWMEPVLRQLCLLEAHYESDQTILALAGKSAQLAEKFGIDTVTDSLLLQDLIVSVNVGQGATSAQGKLANLTNAMGTIRANLSDGVLEQRGLKVLDFMGEVLGIAGYKDAERFFNVDQDPALQAANAKVQELQQALDAKYPPELLAKQVELVAAQVEAALATSLMNNVKAAFASIQTGQVIATMPAVAPIADEVMKAAGYQTPNPAGDDPNYPVPAGPAAPAGDALPQPDAPIDAQGPDQSMQAQAGIPTSTDPMMPAQPASPDAGMNRGIETARSDSGDAA
jgi:hypothetical protein